MRWVLIPLPLLLLACQPAPMGVPPEPGGQTSAPVPKLPVLVDAATALPAEPLYVAVEGQLTSVTVPGAGWSQPAVRLADGALVHVVGPGADDVLTNEGRRGRVLGVIERRADDADLGIVARVATEREPVVLPARPEDISIALTDPFADAVGEGARHLIAPRRGPFAPGRPITAALVLETSERVSALVPQPGEEARRLTLPYALDELQDVLFLNVDGDNHLEWIVMATWMTGVGPEGAVPFQANIVIDFSADGPRRLPEVEARIEELTTVEAIREVLHRGPLATVGAPNLLRVLAIAQACAEREPHGGAGRGGSPLRLDREVALREEPRGRWAVTFAEEAASELPRGLELKVDPATSTCDGRLVNPDGPGGVVNAPTLLQAARRCATRPSHGGRGVSGSPVSLVSPAALTWLGGRTFVVHLPEHGEGSGPSGLDLKIDGEGLCQAVHVD